MNDASQDILHVLGVAEDILANRAGFLDMWCSRDPGVRRENAQDKFAAETALLLWLAARDPVRREELGSAITSVARRLAPLVRTERHLEILAASPQAFIGAAMPHVLLQSMGFVDDLFEEAARAASSSPYLKSTDRPNFRQMELRWLCSIHERADLPFDDLQAQGLIACPLHPVFMRREDAYAVTHAAMYMTDFGRRKPALSPELAASVARFVEQTLCWCLAERDWDLLGEVLMTAAMCGCPAGAAAVTARAVLGDVFGLHGCVPGPDFVAGELLSLEDDARRMHVHVHSYHSSYVYGMLRCIEQAAFLPGPDLLRSHPRYRSWLVGDAPALLLEDPAFGGDAVFLNARIIRAARSCDYGSCLRYIEDHQESGDPSVRESCGAVAEKVMQHIRAKAYGLAQSQLLPPMDERVAALRHP